jgi:predicted Rossmann-fold nucleotide-binding protein
MRAGIDERIDKSHFRVAIFGSARLTTDSPVYQTIYELAKMISEEGMDLVTGGGPGLMNAASEGHHHLDIKTEFNHFSNRLDTFMRYSNAVIVASGGVGTLLELFYTWQLMQVQHTCHIPIILLGQMWKDLVNWIKRWPLQNELLDQNDVELLYLASDYHEAFQIILEAYKSYQRNDENFCLNYQKYKL